MVDITDVYGSLDSSLVLSGIGIKGELRRFSMVVVEETAKFLGADDLAQRCFVWWRFDALVAESLMIAMPMIVIEILRDRDKQRRFAKQDQTRQALRLQAQKEPFDVRVAVRTSWRRECWFNSGLFQRSSKRLCEFRVSIH